MQLFEVIDVFGRISLTRTQNSQNSLHSLALIDILNRGRYCWDSSHIRDGTCVVLELDTGTFWRPWSNLGVNPPVKWVGGANDLEAKCYGGYNGRENTRAEERFKML